MKLSNRVAIYIRYSSENQRDGYSVEYQQEECLKYINNNGWHFVKAYIDEAVTGKSTDKRTSFFELLSDCKQGLYDVVLVYKYSRFARNLMEARLYHHQLEKQGVKLISAMEQIDDTTPEGRMMRNIIMTMDEYYSDNLSTFVQSSMHTAAKQGKYLGGSPPYGFKIENGKFIENTEEANIIRKIYQLRAEGMQPSDILKLLNAEGITSRNNKPFTQQLLHKIFRSEKYIGVYNYKVKGYEPVRIPDALPKIVDDQVFNKVQIELNKNSNKPKGRARRYSYPLTGLIRCEICGEHFTGTSKGKTSNLKYYVCRGRDKLAKCDNHSIKKEEIEDYVFKHLQELIKNDKEHLVGLILEQIEETPEQDTKALISQKQKLEAKINKLVDLMLEDTLPLDVLKARLDPLKQELADIEQIIKIQQYNASNVITEEKVRNFLDTTLNQLERSDDLIKKTIAEQFIDSIIINKQEVKIKIMVSPNFIGDKINKGWAVLCLNPKRKKNRSGFSLLEK